MFSKLHYKKGAFLSSDSISWKLTFLEKIDLKNWLQSTRTSTIDFGKIPLKASGRSLSINTWQSWLFIPFITFFFESTSLEILDAYPSGNFNLDIQSQTTLTWLFSNVYFAFGIAVLPFAYTFKCKSRTITNYLQISPWIFVIFCLSFHIHDCIEYVVKYILLNVHNIQVMSN